MIRINKLDFQGDDLIFQYSREGDDANNIRSRAIIIHWKAMPEIVNILTNLFETVANKCIPGDTHSELDWNQFLIELKKYEEHIKKANKAEGQNDNK